VICTQQVRAASSFSTPQLMRRGWIKHVSENLRFGLGTSQIDQPFCRLHPLERRLVESHTTVIIPLDDRVIFVSLLNCAECSSRLSEVAQTLDAISGIQHLVGGSRLRERWLLGSV